jgi:hypothetical protein
MRLTPGISMRRLKTPGNPALRKSGQKGITETTKTKATGKM